MAHLKKKKKKLLNLSKSLNLTSNISFNRFVHLRRH